MIRPFLAAAALAVLSSNIPAQMTQFCFPGQGGIISCPCGNPPAGGGLGCDNFGVGPAQSGTLTATGLASLSADTVLLVATGENNTSWTAFWTGQTPASTTGLPHAAGVRCVTVNLKRLYPTPWFNPSNASGGAITRPGTGDPSVSGRSATLGVPISVGETRLYFCIYRDPLAAGPCGNSASTINLTNSGWIIWGP
jgi:hypothetical protein